MFAQTTELVDKGLSFADRFGWEALVIVIFLGFVMTMIWKWGGKVVDAIVDYIIETRTQQSKINEYKEQLAESMVAMANAQTACAVQATKNGEKVDRIIDGLKLAIDAADTMVPDDDRQMKKKIADIRAVLNE